MAIYHFDLAPVRRSAGQTSTGAAAYQSGTRLQDSRTGILYNFRRKAPGVVASGLEGWPGDRGSLWNAAEAAERRKDGVPGRRIILALPAELDEAASIRLVRDFAARVAQRHGIAVDWAIHRPDTHGDSRNTHAHILLSSRRVEGDRLGPKAREFDDRQEGPKTLSLLREDWADLVNEALGRAGVLARVDHRRRRDREPMEHLGPAASALERRGIRTARGGRNRRKRLSRIRPDLAPVSVETTSERIAGMLETKTRRLVRPVQRTLERTAQILLEDER